MKNGSRSFKTGFSDFQESQEVVFCSQGRISELQESQEVVSCSQEEFQNYKKFEKWFCKLQKQVPIP